MTPQKSMLSKESIPSPEKYLDPIRVPKRHDEGPSITYHAHATDFLPSIFMVESVDVPALFGNFSVSRLFFFQ